MNLLYAQSSGISYRMRVWNQQWTVNTEHIAYTRTWILILDNDFDFNHFAFRSIALYIVNDGPVNSPIATDSHLAIYIYSWYECGAIFNMNN